MHLTARDIAQLTGGDIAGKEDSVVAGVAGIREARDGDCSFIASPKYFSALKTTKATIVIIARSAIVEFGGTLIRVDNPVQAFTRVVMRLMPTPVKFASGIHPSAVIAKTARLGKGICIQANAVIEEEVVIGDRSVIGAGNYIGHGCRVGADNLFYANVTLREYTVTGERVVLHPGVVLGADGFGYELVDGKHQKIPQVGIVEIGDDVEIGANTAIDRARFGRTSVGRGTKIDNLVQIGHNCVIGEDCIICGGVGLAGSTILGNRVTLAGQVGVAGHLTIGDGAIVMAQSGVSKDVAPGAFVFGSPAVPHNEYKRINAALHRLPETMVKLRELEQQLAQVTKGK